MKLSLNFCILSFLILAISARSYAQSSASASISATITTPISIEKVPGKDLNFGNIAASQSAGIIILNTSGVRRAQGGATLPTTAGTITPAEFVVSGEGSYSFSITLPASQVTMVNSTNNETMIVNGFTSSPETTGTLSAGKLTLKIGATLNVNPNQSPGVYSSIAPFAVTVNYN